MPGAGTRTNNTMSEELKNVLQQIAVMKTMPDADMGFLQTLEGHIIGQLRAPMEQAMQQAAQAGAPLQSAMQQLGMTPGGAPGMPGPAGMPGPGGPQMMGGPPAAFPPPTGVSRLPVMPPVDELRRMLTKK